MDNEYATRRLAAIEARIQSAAEQAQRNAEEIRLIGAAKQQTNNKVKGFVSAGLRDIGHNYLQEALLMRAAINQADPPLHWHYIGAIQSNKTQDIADAFNWVHGVDRLKIAQRLSKQRRGQSLNILLQVNIDEEDSKAGVLARDCLTLCEQVAGLPNLVLRGFMVIPKPRPNPEDQRQPFAKTRELLDQCNQHLGLTMDTLSMGMSNDLEAAILEGSTMVRVGTDLFGKRPTKA